MRVENAAIPQSVEDYFIDLYAGAGAVRIVVEDRFGVLGGSFDDAMSRLAALHPQVRALPTEHGLLRFAVPIGRTGPQHIVVDLAVADQLGSGSSWQLRAYGKEGKLNRRPTARLADGIEAVLSGRAA